MKEALLLILIFADWDSIDGLKFVHQVAKILGILWTKFLIPKDTLDGPTKRIYQEFLEFIKRKYSNKETFMGQKKEYSHSIKLVQTISQLLATLN